MIYKSQSTPRALSTQSKSLRNNKNFPLKNVTEKIIACAIEVHSVLGPGLFEKIYEEALATELTLRNINFERQKSLDIIYKNHCIGKYQLDFLIEKKAIVELKCVDVLKPIHFTQVLTYLRAENLNVGLLINFNVERLKEGIKRIIN